MLTSITDSGSENGMLGKRNTPGIPYWIKCAICPGQEAKIDHKLGRWKISRDNWQKEIGGLSS